MKKNRRRGIWIFILYRRGIFTGRKLQGYGETYSFGKTKTQ